MVVLVEWQQAPRLMENVFQRSMGLFQMRRFATAPETAKETCSIQ